MTNILELVKILFIDLFFKYSQNFRPTRFKQIFGFVRSVQIKIWDWIFVSPELFLQIFRSLCPFGRIIFGIRRLKLITLLLLVKAVLCLLFYNNFFALQILTR